MHAPKHNRHNNTYPPLSSTGKDAAAVDTDWFLCPVRILDHEGPLLTGTFPIENRITSAQSKADLKAHLARHAALPYEVGWLPPPSCLCFGRCGERQGARGVVGRCGLGRVGPGRGGGRAALRLSLPLSHSFLTPPRLFLPPPRRLPIKTKTKRNRRASPTCTCCCGSRSSPTWTPPTCSRSARRRARGGRCRRATA